MWQQKKKFKNVLQSNDRVQNTEAAADFKAFQVDVILPNSKSQSSLFKSSSSRRQVTQDCSCSPVLIVHLPALCGLIVNMFLATLPGSPTDRAGNTGRQFPLPEMTLHTHLLMQWSGFISLYFSNGISPSHIFFSIFLALA